jgi:hypothetical protein
VTESQSPCRTHGVYDICVRPHAAQVVIDIGVHPELPVPPGTGWHDGQTWNAEMAWELLRSHSRYQTPSCDLS